MFKKQMLLAMMLMAGYAVNSACEEQVKNENEDATAFRINVYKSKHNEDLKKGIPSVDEINGIKAYRWLSLNSKMQGDAKIIEYKANGTFGPEEKLSDFDIDELRRCYGAVAPMGYFWNENREDYDAKHLQFIEALKQSKCVLCTELWDVTESGNVIVINTAGLALQEVCRKVKNQKRDEDFDKRYRANISKTDQQHRAKAAQKKQ